MLPLELKSRTSMEKSYFLKAEDLSMIRDAVFISYSGADLELPTELYQDLKEREYDDVFLDKMSLPKGVPANMQSILEVVVQSRLVVFVLSPSFFTRTKNPMLEMVAAIKSNRKLLPLFYGITVEEFKTEGSRESWYEAWRIWEEIDKRQSQIPDAMKVNICEWKTALEIVGGITGLEFKSNLTTNALYRKSVVSRITALIPPYIRWDDANIKGKTRLCQVVNDLFNHHGFVDGKEFHVLALYAMSGTGKTTTCKALLNYLCREFNTKVCHIQLERAGCTVLERMKKVLGTLTNVSHEILSKIHDPEQGWYLFERHIRDNRVFLAIDNVLEGCVEEASRYLRYGFASGSKILICGRSLEVVSPAVIGTRSCQRNSNILPLPGLLEYEAFEIFVQKMDLGRALNAKEYPIVERCVQLCCLRDADLQGEFGYQQLRRRRSPVAQDMHTESCRYHPLAMESLAVALAAEQPGDWDSTVNSWQSKATQFALHMHEAFAVLQTACEGLKGEFTRQIFIDIAIFAPSHLEDEEELVEWLGCLHGLEKARFSLRELKKRALVQVETGSRRWFVHDLYKAMILAQEHGKSILVFDGQRTAGESTAGDQDHELFWDMMHDAESRKKIQRIKFTACIFDEALSVVKLSSFTELKVVTLVGNRGLQRVELGKKSKKLRSLEVITAADDNSSSIKPVMVHGLKDVQALLLEHCVMGSGGEMLAEGSMEGLAQLRFLVLKSSSQTKLVECVTNVCKKLRVLMITDTIMPPAAKICGLQYLRRIRLERCKGLDNRLGCMASLLLVEKLDVRDCYDLTSLGGSLEKMKGLKEVKLSGLSQLQNLFELTTTDNNNHPSTLEDHHRLVSLCLTNMESLKTLDGIQKLTSLKELKLSHCPALEKPFTSTSFYEVHKFGAKKRIIHPCAEALENLHVHRCEKLITLGELENGSSLRTLTILSCSRLQQMFQGAAAAAMLNYVRIEHCSNLTDISMLHLNPNCFAHMHIRHCPQIQMRLSLGVLMGLDRLTWQDNNRTLCQGTSTAYNFNLEGMWVQLPVQSSHEISIIARHSYNSSFDVFSKLIQWPCNIACRLAFVLTTASSSTRVAAHYCLLGSLQ